LTLALEAYKKSIEKSNSESTSEIIEIIRDESSSLSSSTDKSNSENPQGLKRKPEKKSNTMQDTSGEEEWLNQYMFGKIKEKLSPECLLEILEHYKSSYDHLEVGGVVHPKRLTYKNKSSSFESNEIFYRIYALTLKRIQHFAKDTQYLANLLVFLKQIIASKFVQVHNDLNLEEVSSFLESNIFSKSQMLSQLPDRETFCKCVCICIAGLNQILKRFSQHYRSLYRLAHFYSSFLDFKVNLVFVK
jgi:hypothetical protein